MQGCIGVLGSKDPRSVMCMCGLTTPQKEADPMVTDLNIIHINVDSHRCIELMQWLTTTLSIQASIN